MVVDYIGGIFLVGHIQGRQRCDFTIDAEQDFLEITIMIEIKNSFPISFNHNQQKGGEM